MRILGKYCTLWWKQTAWYDDSRYHLDHFYPQYRKIHPLGFKMAAIKGTFFWFFPIFRKTVHTRRKWQDTKFVEDKISNKMMYNLCIQDGPKRVICSVKDDPILTRWSTGVRGERRWVSGISNVFLKDNNTAFCDEDKGLGIPLA